MEPSTDRCGQQQPATQAGSFACVRTKKSVFRNVNFSPVALSHANFSHAGMLFRGRGNAHGRGAVMMLP
jgi:hypothetical protein